MSKKLSGKISDGTKNNDNAMTLREHDMGLSEEDYHAYPCWSYSLLSRFDREGPSALWAEEQQQTAAMSFGSLVDCLVTRGEEEFDRLYAVADDITVTPAIRQIIDELVSSNVNAMFLAMLSDDEVLRAADQFGYQLNWKAATRAAKIRELGGAYYKQAAANRGKTFVQQQDADDARRAAFAIMSDAKMQRFLDTSAFSENEVIWQLQLTKLDPATGIAYKGMLDAVSINHQDKVVTPIDIKTTKDVYLFEDSFYQWRYYIQAGMYDDLLRSAMDKSDIADYNIGPYRFFVIDRKLFRPIVFLWSVTDRVYDKFGIRRPSWRELLLKAEWLNKHRDDPLPEAWMEGYDLYGGVPIMNYADEIKNLVPLRLDE